MAGDYRSITDGLLLISTIVFWNYLVDWLAFRWRWLGHVLEPPPLLLIEHGQMNRANMRREFLTPDELHSRLREKGVEDLDSGEACGDGKRRRDQCDPRRSRSDRP